MASGEMHVKATVILSAPAAFAAASMAADWGAGLACFAGVLSGIVISPDLDMSQRTRSEYLVSRYLGGILGFIWYLLWWPYAKAIPHRHALSHWPLLGTFLRLAYLLVFSFPLWFALGRVLGGRAFAFSAPPPSVLNLIFWWITGLIAADSLHFVMDVLPFFRQSRRQRRWWQRIF